MMNRFKLAAGLAMLQSEGVNFGIPKGNRVHRDRLDPNNSEHAPILSERIAAAEAKRARKNAKRKLTQ